MMNEFAKSCRCKKNWWRGTISPFSDGDDEAEVNNNKDQKREMTVLPVVVRMLIKGD